MFKYTYRVIRTQDDPMHGEAQEVHLELLLAMPDRNG